MIRPLLLAAAASLILGSAPPKPAAADVPAREDCRDEDGIDRCDPEQQRRVRERFGVSPIESHREAGDQVRRAFYVDGYGNDVVAIVFIRPKGQEPQLWVHFPRWSDGERAEPLRVPVPQTVWDSVLERSRYFDRRLMPDPQSRGNGTVICSESPVYTVEAADPLEPGSVDVALRRRTERACDGGLTEVYAEELQRAAVPLLPHCAKLDLRLHGTEASLLAFCAKLAGDRLAAADVLNRSNPFRLLRQPGDFTKLDGLFQYQAIVDWNGERNEGLGSAHKFWAEKATERSGTFFYEKVEGKTARLVHLRGSLVRWVAGSEGENLASERARFEQVWTNDYGTFVISRITVGPFVRQPRAR